MKLFCKFLVFFRQTRHVGKQNKMALVNCFISLLHELYWYNTWKWFSSLQLCCWTKQPLHLYPTSIPWALILIYHNDWHVSDVDVCLLSLFEGIREKSMNSMFYSSRMALLSSHILPLLYNKYWNCPLFLFSHSTFENVTPLLFQTLGLERFHIHNFQTERRQMSLPLLDLREKLEIKEYSCIFPLERKQDVWLLPFLTFCQFIFFVKYVKLYS